MLNANLRKNSTVNYINWNTIINVYLLVCCWNVSSDSSLFTFGLFNSRLNLNKELSKENYQQQTCCWTLMAKFLWFCIHFGWFVNVLEISNPTFVYDRVTMTKPVDGRYDNLLWSGLVDMKTLWTRNVVIGTISCTNFIAAIIRNVLHIQLDLLHSLSSQKLRITRILLLRYH